MLRSIDAAIGVIEVAAMIVMFTMMRSAALFVVESFGCQFETT